MRAYAVCYHCCLLSMSDRHIKKILKIIFLMLFTVLLPRLFDPSLFLPTMEQHVLLYTVSIKGLEAPAGATADTCLDRLNRSIYVQSLKETLETDRLAVQPENWVKEDENQLRTGDGSFHELLQSFVDVWPIANTAYEDGIPLCNMIGTSLTSEGVSCGVAVAVYASIPHQFSEYRNLASFLDTKLEFPEQLNARNMWFINTLFGSGVENSKAVSEWNVVDLGPKKWFDDMEAYNQLLTRPKLSDEQKKQANIINHCIRMCRLWIRSYNRFDED